MTSQELKLRITTDLITLSIQAQAFSKVTNNTDEQNELNEIGVMLQTIAKSIENNNYQELMKSDSVVKIMLS